MRVPRVLTVGLVLLLIGGSLWVYPTLPDHIPRHFGATGQADAHWETTLFRWLLLPCVSLLSAGALYVPVWIVGAVPSSWITVPNQEQYDALPPDKKRVVIGVVQRALDWMIVATLLIFVAVQAGVYYVATTPATALPGIAFGIMALGLLSVLASGGWLVWSLPKRIRSLSSEGADGEAGEATGVP